MITARLYIDKNGQEWIFDYSEDRHASDCKCKNDFIKLPHGAIFKLTGREPIVGHIYQLQRHEKSPPKI
jgi:hypothetical protein